MEGNPPPTDYAAILADMEAKYAILGNAITSLRALLGAGVVGPIGDMSLPGSAPAAPTSTGPPVSLPRGAFLSKTVTEAIKLYLSAARRKQTNKEIAQALKDGGLESTGKSFDSYVTGGLFRLKNEGVVLRFDDGWGLAEWYPESFRNRVAQDKPNGTKKKKKKKAKAKRAQHAASPDETPTPKAESLSPGVEAQIMEIFSSAIAAGVDIDADDISNGLAIDKRVASPALGRLAAKGKIVKTAEGYRMVGESAQQATKAS